MCLYCAFNGIILADGLFAAGCDWDIACVFILFHRNTDFKRNHLKLFHFCHLVVFWSLHASNWSADHKPTYSHCLEDPLNYWNSTKEVSYCTKVE